MNKLKKILLLLIMINILFVSTEGFFNNVSFAAQSISTDINKLDNNKYPGIKSMIQDLQKKYPNWSFKVLYTGLKWSEVISKEHNSHGNNLVQANSIYYDREWICEECGSKTYDTGRWHCASKVTVEYMMDPRNSINEDDIFQFLQLSYVDCNYTDLQSMVANYGYLNKKDLLQKIISIGKEKNVNPYFIVAKIIQEQGNGTGILATGKSYKGTDGVTYEGYYNYLNINASGNGSANVITNGLKYAKNKGWDTPEKSIEGGLDTIANNYIKYGQDTMYFQKFNVSSTKYSYYTHQYMQNVMGAQSEGTILRRSLEKNNLKNAKYTFIIPLYEGTPRNACRKPISTYNSGNTPTPTSRADDDSRLDTTNDVVIAENIKKNDTEKSITTIQGINVKQIINATGEKEIKSLDGKVLDEDDLVGTGCTINDYTIVVIGDLNGDGKINSGDSLLLSKQVLKTINLTDTYKKQAADVNNDGKINSGDTLIVRKNILGNYKISI